MEHGRLLAIDLGVKTGFALYTSEPLLLAYGSRNYGNASRLKRAARSMLHDIPGLTQLVIEGGGPLSNGWIAEAKRLGLPVLQVSAEAWRERLFWQRDIRTGPQAKQNAILLARRVIDYLGGAKPLVSMQDDAAEAILLGWWALEKIGWIDKLPRI